MGADNRTGATQKSAPLSGESARVGICICVYKLGLFDQRVGDGIKLLLVWTWWRVSLPFELPWIRTKGDPHESYSTGR